MIADLATGDDVEEIAGVGVKVLLLSRFQRRLQHAHPRVLELETQGLCVDDEWILSECALGRKQQQPDHECEFLHDNLLMTLCSIDQTSFSQDAARKSIG